MKKILLPVDGSIHSTHALQYAVMMSPGLQDLTYALFHVQPILSDFIMEEAKKDPAAMKKLKQLNENNAVLGNEILNSHKDRLMRLGVPEKNIKQLTQTRRQGLARDIIKQAANESVDAIVMARRGYSKFQEVFIGSTTKNVIDHNAEMPIWVVDGEITSRNIILPVDGSTNSVKALDYLLDILQQHPDVELTLFHVQPSLKDCCEIDFTSAPNQEDLESVEKIILQANQQCVDNFLQLAQRKMSEKEINEDKLHIKTQPVMTNIGKAIVDEFRQGDYGTVVVGKRGIDKKFFMGSVSNYLVTHLTNAALWIVP